MIGIDGEDHINVYSNGKTELGRWLSNFAYSPIKLPEDGNFKSIEGYWYWLSTQLESLRLAVGYNAKLIGKQFTGNKIKLPAEVFQQKIKDAIDIKLKSNIPMLKELALSTLPLVHYYEFGNPPVRKHAGYEWIIEHIESRRKLLKESNYGNN